MSGTNYSQLALKKFKKLGAGISIMEVQRCVSLIMCMCASKEHTCIRNLSVTGNFYENDVRRISLLLAFSFNRFSYIAQTVNRSDHFFPHECLFGLEPRPAGLECDCGCKSSFGNCTSVYI